MNKTRIRQKRILFSPSILRVGISILAGAVWGIGWGMGVESYLREEIWTLWGYRLSPFQITGIGLILAIGALVTVAWTYHFRASFLRAALTSFVSAGITALVFYVGLVFLAFLTPTIPPAQLEKWLLPGGWALENGVLWLAMYATGAANVTRMARKHIQILAIPRDFRAQQQNPNGRLLQLYWLGFLSTIGVAWFFTLCTLWDNSIGILLALFPPLVWGGLAFLAELEPRGNAADKLST